MALENVNDLKEIIEGAIAPIVKEMQTLKQEVAVLKEVAEQAEQRAEQAKNEAYYDLIV